MGIKIANALIAIVAGVGSVLVLFWAANALVERLPAKISDRLKPWVFVGPAVLLIGAFLIYPAIRTIVLAFMDQGGDTFVGIANFTDLATDSAFHQTLLNTLLWIIIVPVSAVVIGLLVAILADRLAPRGEKFTKSMIFLPMAISMVGASTIWQFIYNWKPAGRDQIGLLNAIVVAFGGEPQTWLQNQEFKLNSLLLMVILIWLQTGYAMVLLSSAIKGVPEETIEAARIDGASEVQAFFQIIVPQIWGTVVTVFVTILIGVMKVFDIIYVTTRGLYNTNVIANDFFITLFQFGDSGRSSAIVVVLLIAVIPVMVYQVRRFKAEEAMK
ncbi:MAG TPA: sugar ABC transporter permease [Actinotalea sp.]|nr:sugar ABC transporter permease [Actinotalea sp.]